MKIYLLAALLLLCTAGFAQEGGLPNDLNTNFDQITIKYFPAYNKALLYSNYLLDPLEFNQKVEQVRREAYELVKTADPKLTALKQMDVDYSLRNFTATYKSMYGIDSAKMMGLLKLVAEKSKDPKFGTLVMDASQKMYLKRMTPAQVAFTDSLIFANTDPNNDMVYGHSDAYRKWIETYLDQMYKTKHKADTTFKNIKGGMPLGVITAEIKSPLIRDIEYYMHTNMNLKVVKDPVLFQKTYDEFVALETKPTLKDKIKELYENNQRMHTANSAAPDFTYADVNGKQVTLSSLRGKYVYIDVWATWCVPCKGEIPYLTKIEEAYKGKNIQFVSLSVDAQRDAAKWRGYVKDNKLGGYQVMADKDFQSEFVTKFNIASIPRFILIDPAGNIVDADAKRPSDPKLKEQLDKLL